MLIHQALPRELPQRVQRNINIIRTYSPGATETRRSLGIHSQKAEERKGDLISYAQKPTCSSPTSGIWAQQSQEQGKVRRMLVTVEKESKYVIGKQGDGNTAIKGKKLRTVEKDDKYDADRSLDRKPEGKILQGQQPILLKGKQKSGASKIQTVKAEEQKPVDCKSIDNKPVNRKSIDKKQQGEKPREGRRVSSSHHNLACWDFRQMATYLYGNYEGQTIGKGIRHGYGIQRFKTNQKYMGRFAYDAMCGQGTYYTMDGRIIMGIWEDNVLKEIIFQI